MVNKTARHLCALPLVLLTLLLTAGACASPAARRTPDSIATIPALSSTSAPTAAATDPADTPVPAATPSPEPRITVGCSDAVPEEARARLREAIAPDTRFVWSDDAAGAGVRLTIAEPGQASPTGVWTYALAAPFRTIDDGVALADLQAAWAGRPAGALAAHPLLVSPDTQRVFAALWGSPDPNTVRAVDGAELLAEAERASAWAIVPFDGLEMRWKVLQVDGVSPLSKGLDQSGSRTYALQVPLALTGERVQDLLPLVAQAPDMLTNRVEGRMTTLAMTGVTALVRATAKVMEAYGVTYPARDIKDWLLGADLTHISNEVCFDPNYQVQTDPESLVFSSKDTYIELLEAVGTDIVEMTGNHMLDHGVEPLFHTLQMYRERGWQWYAAGEDLASAVAPLKIEHNGNRIAFLGCNYWGPPWVWATEDSPGTAPWDQERMQAQIRALRSEGYLPIVTFQYVETYEYTPMPQQVIDFRAMAEAGAVVVQGSQAHQPQALEFQGDAFIHYGLGNLFFDQMQTLGTRQEFVDVLVFYDNRLLSVELRTAMLEDWARPRPMTPEERAVLLGEIFAIEPGSVLAE